MSLYVGDRLVCRLHLHTRRSPNRFTYTRYRINTIDSPDDEHRDARNMWRIGINIYEKRIVRQVGYLQELFCIDLRRRYYGTATPNWMLG